MAAILQDVASVFETDALRPLVELAEELSGRSYGDDGATTRAMRILADHSRGAAALIADGVVPSNEDRGYVLRRIMRRAIQQGRAIGLEAPFMGRFAERALETARRPPTRELAAERETSRAGCTTRRRASAARSIAARELLEDLIAERRGAGTSWVDAEDAFKLHDTYGFPYDLTKELLAEEGLVGGRRGLRGADGGAAQRARTGDARTRHGSEDHHGAVLSVRLRGAPIALRRLREAAGRDQPRRGRAPTTGGRW